MSGNSLNQTTPKKICPGIHWIKQPPKKLDPQTYLGRHPTTKSLQNQFTPNKPRLPNTWPWGMTGPPKHTLNRRYDWKTRGNMTGFHGFPAFPQNLSHQTISQQISTLLKAQTWWNPCHARGGSRGFLVGFLLRKPGGLQLQRWKWSRASLSHLW